MRHAEQMRVAVSVRIAVLVVAVGLCGGAGAAQTWQDDVVNQLEAVIKAAQQVDGPAAFKKKLSYKTEFANTLISYLYFQRHPGTLPSNPLLLALQEARTDKQVGSSSPNSGTTSLATKGGAPTILGFAVENGALAQEVNGSTVTFRGNPVGLVGFLHGKDILDIHDFLAKDPTLMALTKLSFSFSFDTTRGSAPGTFQATRDQLASYSLRYEILNRRDPRDRRYDQAWKNTVFGPAAIALNRVESVRDKIIELDTKDPNQSPWVGFAVWLKKASQLGETYEKSASSAGFHTDVLALLAELTTIPTALTDQGRILQAEFYTAIDAAGEDLTKLVVSRDKVRELARAGALVTFEFTNTRDPKLPDLYNMLLIGQTRIGSRADFTANAAVSFFRTTTLLPAGSSRWRDVHAAGQLDIAVGNVRSVGMVTLSLGGRWEYLPQDTRTPGNVDLASKTSIFSGPPPTVDTGGLLVTPKGHIGIFQAKLTIPAKGSGVSIPLSFTVSNRTELIKEKDVRAGIGITFDLDTILSKKQ